MKSLKKVFQLSPQELWLLVQAALLLPTVRLALNFTTVARLQGIGAADRPAVVASGVSPPTIARMVQIAADHGVYQASCLQKALVLSALLRRHHVENEIRFGARKEQGELEAHAWVEVRGVALNEDDGVDQRYSILGELAALISN